MNKILFLAQFAPTEGKLLNIPRTPEEKFYAETYHWKIIESLKRQGYDFDTASDVNFLLKNHAQYDLVWSVYNRLGFRNSEVFVQSLCEYLGTKYIGAAPNVRALIEDKSLSKQLAEHIGLKTAKWVVASKKYPLCCIAPFPGPYFIKPRFGSASIGIDERSFCETWQCVKSRAEDYFKQDIEIIVEQYISGMCYGVSMLNTTSGEPLIAPPHYTISNKVGNIMTHSQKRFAEDGMKRYPSCDKKLNQQLEYLSKEYFLQIQPCDYARIDFIVESDSSIPYFLEANVLMNLGIYGGFVNSFLESHFSSYDEIINHIIRVGLSKLDNNNSLSNP